MWNLFEVCELSGVENKLEHTACRMSPKTIMTLNKLIQEMHAYNRRAAQDSAGVAWQGPLALCYSLIGDAKQIVDELLFAQAELGQRFIPGHRRDPSSCKLLFRVGFFDLSA